MNTEQETHNIAQWLYDTIQVPACIALTGELGSGKTSFARGILRAAGWSGRVPSPTFTLVHEYQTSPPVFHADLYRLADEDELEDLALNELTSRGILLVEWADRFPAFYGSCSVRVSLAADPTDASGGRRQLKISTSE